MKQKSRFPLSPFLFSVALCLCVSIFSSPPSHAAEPGDAPPTDGPQKRLIGQIEYKKLATRAETEAAIRHRLFPDQPVWGNWSMVSGFPFDQKPGLNLAAVLPPEEELAKMSAGGPGPDLSKTYAGKQDRKLAWTPMGDIDARAIDLAVTGDKAIDENAVGYLYAAVTAAKDITVDVTMGSDDGLRFWLNGKLLVDADVMRGLDPYEHKVRLDFKKGVNHVLAKVSNGRVTFQYQINAKPPLDPQVDAQLQYYLNSDFPLTPEEKYYRCITIPTPPEVILEVGGLDVLPANERGAKGGNGRPVVSTRRGDVWIVEGAYDDPPFNAKFIKFAAGLHEPLGVQARVEDGKTTVYCVQRGELTKLVDTDGDDVADEYTTVCAGWGVSGNYHEFAFGPKFDRDGNMWVTLNVGFCGALGKSIAPYRGWSLKVTPKGEMIPWSDGLRSPNGIGEWTDGTMFYLDNQGDYVGTNRLAPLLKGGYSGHPAGLRWRPGWTEGQTPPEIVPATIWFPYKKMGQSTADFLLYPPPKEGLTAFDPGAFGPFEGQVFVGDQTNCLVERCTIEKIDGVYQGACYPFRESLQCGVNRLAWGTDRSMFVGQTDRGWGSIGRARYGLERLVWTKAHPFELREMRITPTGFELEFTGDLDPKAAGDATSYAMNSYTYEYHQTYGSAEMDTKKVEITKAELAGPRTVRLTLGEWRSGGMGYVHELTMPGVKAAGGEGLLHPSAFYTVQRVPR